MNGVDRLSTVNHQGANRMKRVISEHQGISRRLSVSLALGIVFAACLTTGSSARAEFGDDYGLAAGEGVFPSAEAFWAGTCDLRDTTTDAGGLGTVPVSSPMHCIDVGEPAIPPSPNEAVWEADGEPAWRLDPAAQAASHPDATTAFYLRRSPELSTFFTPQAEGDTKNVMVSLPAGTIGNPNAVPTCKSKDMNATPVTCRPETQVGVASVALGQATAGAEVKLIHQPLYNAEPRDGKTAEFIFSPSPARTNGANIPIVASARTDGDFGIDAMAMNIPGGISLLGQAITLWGVPWATSHDIFRPVAGYQGSDSERSGGFPATGLAGGVDGTDSQEPQSYDPSWGPIRPFFTSPTECSGDLLRTGLELTSWQKPNEARVFSTLTDVPVAGCGEVPFEPAISVEPTSHVADSPTGLRVELSIPQHNDPPFPLRNDPDDETGAPAYWQSQQGLATAHLEDTTVALPAGMSVNPAGANGQAACSPDQVGLTNTDPIRFDNSDPDDGQGSDCPAASKIGTVKIETPLLTEEDWPQGTVYLAEQGNKGVSQGSNPFDSMLAIYIVAESPKRGLTIKLAGEVKPDDETGQLVTTFLNNPQLPFDRFDLRFKGGPHAPLANPVTCGSKEATASLSPYAAPSVPAEAVDSFEINEGPGGLPCATTPSDRPFDLEMSAGLVDPTATASSPFVLRLERPDGHQEIDRVQVTAPEGLTAVLRLASQCSEVAIEAESCPESSRVGSSLAGAGAGESPYYVDPGDVYLAGPYDPDGNGPKPEAPLSLSIQVPAVAGPFDLGMVSVRAAIYVDPQTAQITVASDPIPKILEGIPLRVRDLRVAIDRAGFMVAPSDCDPMSVDAAVRGSGGATSQESNDFRVGKCGDLDFAPKLKLRYKGKGAKKRNSHPRLAASLKVPHAEGTFDPDTPDAGPSQTNISKVRVTLPKGTFLDQDSLETICTRPQWAVEECPEGALVGHAKAWSPLLDEPLEGPVYLKSSDNQLPDLAADLNGIVDIDLFGRIDQSKGRIRNTFDVVPDVAVSKFKLNLSGGDGGLLVNSKDICKGKKKLRRANVAMTAQNEARLKDKQSVVRCGGKKGKRNRRSR